MNRPIQTVFVGLLEGLYPDGAPASIWFSNFSWAAAAILEGLMEGGVG